MHIMFVDDTPYEKVDHLIRYLKEHCDEFASNGTYDVIKSSDSAIRYLKEHENDIDLAVVDLGLPKNDDGDNYHILRGLDIIDEICNNHPKIPVIINSVTDVPKQKLQQYADSGLIVKHCKPLLSQKLIRFMQKGNVHLIEPNIDYSGVFVFWVDTDDDSLVRKYYNRLKETLIELNAEVTVSSNKIRLVSNDAGLEILIRHTGTDGMELFDGNISGLIKNKKV